jgi:hypothetical protein
MFWGKGLLNGSVQTKIAPQMRSKSRSEKVLSLSLLSLLLLLSWSAETTLPSPLSSYSPPDPPLACSLALIVAISFE